MIFVERSGGWLPYQKTMLIPSPLAKCVLAAICLWLGLSCDVARAQRGQSDDELQQRFLDLYAQWRHAPTGQEKEQLGSALYEAAVRQDRPDVAEQTVVGGPLASRQLSLQGRSERVPLHEVHTFEEIDVKPEDAHDQAPNQGNGWLTRRLTDNALEVWTPKHGWLFDGAGRLLNEAHSPRQDTGTGREWYGAFLPEGRWVTTEVSDYDCALSFFSRDGKLLKTIPSAELAPPGPYHPEHSLLGWARSDKEGVAWIVNVGSEEGYATVQVGPEGSARTLLGTERWAACYRRALARGVTTSACGHRTMRAKRCSNETKQVMASTSATPLTP